MNAKDFIQAELRRREEVANFMRIDQVERTVLERALELCNQNHAAAARLAGISRRTLYRKLAKYRLEMLNQSSQHPEQQAQSHAVDAVGEAQSTEQEADRR